MAAGLCLFPFGQTPPEKHYSGGLILLSPCPCQGVVYDNVFVRVVIFQSSADL